MGIFAEVTENERIIDRHLRGIHPLPDYDDYDLDLIEIGLSALYSFSVKTLISILCSSRSRTVSLR